MSVPQKLLRAIAAELGVEPTALTARPTGGGFSTTAEIVVERRRLFVKYFGRGSEEAGPGARGATFVREAMGLGALARPSLPLEARQRGDPQRGDRELTQSARGVGAEAAEPRWRAPVVEVIAASSEPPYLLLEFVERGTPTSHTWARLGRDLATIHRHSAEAAAQRPAGQQFGFPVDNWLGATPQPNGWCADWVEFFSRHRLGYQLRRLRRSGELDAECARAQERLMVRLPALLSEPAEPPCVLHGDLWSGNVLIDGGGRALLIDPATYCGRREADLAMTRLFGGFDARFYAAYEEVWPLAPGAQQRLEIYELYHLLNHWNLFGRSYRDACLRIAQRYG